MPRNRCTNPLRSLNLGLGLILGLGLDRVVTVEKPLSSKMIGWLASTEWTRSTNIVSNQIGLRSECEWRLFRARKEKEIVMFAGKPVKMPYRYQIFVLRVNFLNLILNPYSF